MLYQWARFVFGIFWLAFGLPILLRHQLGLGWLDDRHDATNLNFSGGILVAYGLWNTFRVLTGRRRANVASVAGRQPLAPKTTPERPFEYIPELDFMKPDGETKPGRNDSASGTV